MGLFGGWDVVAVTAETVSEARAFQAELGQRRKLGALPGVTKDTILLAVPDPHPRPAAPWETKSAVVGSGGATLNAVLAVAEQLSARNGTGTLDATVLQTKRVVCPTFLSGMFPLLAGAHFTPRAFRHLLLLQCILHSSSTHRIPAASCVGKAFSPLPAGLAGSDPSMPGNGLACNIDLILLVLQGWVGDASPGVWVCSTEPFLNLPGSAHRCAAPIAWTDGITAIALPTDLSTGSSHGVYKINAASKVVERILYRATADELVDSGVVSKSGTVPVVAPIVRFSADAAELLLGLYACAPLDGCTYYGYDAGGSATAVNLYLDILGACCAGTSFEEYCSPSLGTPPLFYMHDNGLPRSPATYTLTGSLTAQKQMQKCLRLLDLVHLLLSRGRPAPARWVAAAPYVSCCGRPFIRLLSLLHIHLAWARTTTQAGPSTRHRLLTLPMPQSTCNSLRLDHCGTEARMATDSEAC